MGTRAEIGENLKKKILKAGGIKEELPIPEETIVRALKTLGFEQHDTGEVIKRVSRKQKGIGAQVNYFIVQLKNQSCWIRKVDKAQEGDGLPAVICLDQKNPKLVIDELKIEVEGSEIVAEVSYKILGWTICPPAILKQLNELLQIKPATVRLQL